MTDHDDEYLTDRYELLEAVEAVVQASDPAKREALADTIEAYATGGLSDEWNWATGPQSPVLLHHLIKAIDSACRPENQSKPRAAIRLVDRKPLGNA